MMSSRIFYFVLILSYFMFEAVFNSLLLDISSRSTVEMSDLHDIEMFGRVLSSFGFTFFIMSVIKDRFALKGFILPTFFSVVLFSFFFAGQKWLVDYYVDKTTADQRAKAYSLNLVKSGFINGTMRMDGVAYRPGQLLSYEDKTFLSLIGLFAKYSPEIMKQTEVNPDAFIRDVVKSRYKVNLVQYYDVYENVSDKIKDSYIAHKRGISRVRKVKEDAKKEALIKLSDIQQRLGNDYKRYMFFKKRYEEDIVGYLKYLKKMLPETYRELNGCFTSSCKNRVIKKYESNMVKLFGPTGANLDVYYWCKNKNGYRYCPTSKKDFRIKTFRESGMLRKVAKASEARFKSKYSNGLPYDIKPGFENFMKNPVVAQLLRQQLALQGYSLPKGWTADDAETFVRVYLEKHKDELKEKVREASFSSGGGSINIKGVSGKKMSFEQFWKLKDVQNKLKEALGVDSGKIRQGLNKSMFYQTVVRPKIEKETQKIKKWIVDQKKELGEGGKYEKQGEDAIKALVIPVVALFLSSLAMLLTLVKVVATPVKKAVKYGFAAYIVSFVLLAYAMSHLGHKVENPALKSFVEKVDKSSPVAGYFIKYFMSVQPAIAPIGDKIRELRAELLDEKQKAKINAYIAKGDQAFKEKKYLTPFEESAMKYYMLVLDIYPEHKKALSKLRMVKDNYLDLYEKTGKKIYKIRAEEVVSHLNKYKPVINIWDTKEVLYFIIMLFAIYFLWSMMGVNNNRASKA